MSESDEVRVAYKVQGRVQGVGFRYWVRRRAQELALRGSVRNLSDGTVEAELAGPAEAVAEMSRLLHRGPAISRVDRVEELAVPDDLPDEFVIRYDES